MIDQHGGHEAEFDEEFEDDEFENEERKPRFRVYALVCLLLAATGSGAAFAWHGYGGGELMTGALTAIPKAASAPQAAAAQDALLRNLADAQQRAAAVAQRNQDLLQAQAAEIKRLSDAVAQLSTRVDGLSVPTHRLPCRSQRRRSRRPRKSSRRSLPRPRRCRSRRRGSSKATLEQYRWRAGGPISASQGLRAQ